MVVMVFVVMIVPFVQGADMGHDPAIRLYAADDLLHSRQQRVGLFRGDHQSAGGKVHRSLHAGKGI